MPSQPRGTVKLANAGIGELNTLAATGLARMFDFERQLFCFRAKRGEHGLVTEGASHRYTVMALLGLQRLAAAGGRSPVDVRTVLESLLADKAWISSIGDVGLMLWLCALASPERLQEIYSGLGVETALTRLREARDGRTMELAWFLSGLAHATLALPQKLPGLRDVAVKSCELLKRNQGDHGFFGHQATGRSLAGAVRGRIGSFADQVYPVYALTRFAQAYEDQAALDMARGCAEAICRVQGPLGQWWWHYDASTGRVFQRYPVYAVHQDGMAPMALFALGEATGLDFSESIYRGLAWITGNNELGSDLRDTSSSVIWRSIYRKGWRGYFSEFLNFLRPGENVEPDGLRILFECRPYHFGWLLYGFAGRDGD
jgi:hypothetical protein